MTTICYFNTPDFANPHVFVREQPGVPRDWQTYPTVNFTRMREQFPDIQLVNVAVAKDFPKEVLIEMSKAEGHVILNG